MADEDDELVTIAAFSHAEEAHLSRGLLETEGIETFVEDEIITTWIPLFPAGEGGIKLRVGHSDAEQALEILRLNDQSADEQNGN